MTDQTLDLVIDTPRWAIPLLEKKRYRGAKGGRGSGKSYQFAEMVIEALAIDPTKRILCIREIQASLKHSAKKLIADRIKAMNVGHLFEIQETQILRLGKNKARQDGLIIFQGMQDHTSESIKSFEGFDIAWIEEAQSMSKKSLDLLDPTIRKQGSEIWASWNPDQPDDAIETFFETREENRKTLVHVNFTQNPFCSDETKEQAKACELYNPDDYDWIWLGQFNKKKKSVIFSGKCKILEFEPGMDWEPLFGVDWGFSLDPTASVQIYHVDDTLYIYREAGKVGLEIDETPNFLKEKMPEMQWSTVRADSARPETISYCQRHGLADMVPVRKWSGSVEDGIAWLRSRKAIIIHPSCEQMIYESRKYSYKIDPQTGEPTRTIVDKDNHFWDAVRYAAEPLISQTLFNYDEIL